MGISILSCLKSGLIWFSASYCTYPLVRRKGKSGIAFFVVPRCNGLLRLAVLVFWHLGTSTGVRAKKVKKSIFFLKRWYWMYFFMLDLSTVISFLYLCTFLQRRDYKLTTFFHFPLGLGSNEVIFFRDYPSATSFPYASEFRSFLLTFQLKRAFTISRKEE